MEDQTADRAREQRHLLPRWPSDVAVAVLLAAGLVGWLLVGVEREWSVVLLAPGAAAAIVQKVAGHWAAWRSAGVERAFVAETSALSFYAGVVGLGGLAVLQAVDVVPPIHAGWLLIAALFTDTTVRKLREGRFA